MKIFFSTQVGRSHTLCFLNQIQAQYNNTNSHKNEKNTTLIHEQLKIEYKVIERTLRT